MNPTEEMTASETEEESNAEHTENECISPEMIGDGSAFTMREAEKRAAYVTCSKKKWKRRRH
ncbi:MAG: hypothetical protein LKE64_07650 [Solobacterium sp.]|nr:hypothetical protein [Solobacterium sp.]MCH4048893.1 hypothetical protein [Solobacterium sp.]MCH4074353.1 hypothetical protein [Solobacterium sp.]MCI1314120.1 hypothetical protein [Solobacterium sp.]MCI1346314.1 hypothetical protein [Solobacterium sp.]